MMKLRAEHIFNQEMGADISLREEGILNMLFGKKYTQKEMDEKWKAGVKLGIEIGLYHSSPEGQRIQLRNNMPNGKHKEFLEKHYALMKEYNCGIEYHPRIGLVVLDRDYK